MERGIFRIIAGVIMILSQLIAMLGSAKTGDFVSGSFLYSLNYYSIGITGIILLIYGIHTYKNGYYSKLIIHTNTKKIHTAGKWIAFVITIIHFISYLISYISSGDILDIYTILMILAALSFAVYLLFYENKKPSCLFSTTLICIGVAYLYNLVFLFDFSDTSFVILSFIPRLVSGILYITIAVKLYKEKFSANAIRIMGWIVFVLELINKIIYGVVLLGNFRFINTEILLIILFATALFLYISVFKINTLQESSVEKAEDIIRFCRKCGAQLRGSGNFCWKCGTKIIKE